MDDKSKQILAKNQKEILTKESYQKQYLSLDPRGYISLVLSIVCWIIGAIIIIMNIGKAPSIYHTNVQMASYILGGVIIAIGIIFDIAYYVILNRIKQQYQIYLQSVWQCQTCGNVNPNYTTTCACGNKK